MKLIRFENNNDIRTGLLKGSNVIDLYAALPELQGIANNGDMTALLTGGDAVLDQIRLANMSGNEIPLEQVKLLSPTTNPSKMIAAWVNYLPEGGKPPSEQPIFFAKFPSSIISADGDKIVLPKSTQKVVVEPELTVVIGKRCHNVSAEDAMSYVAGYTIVNDVTSFNHRLVDLLDVRGPNMMAKVFDTFAPTGPAIVTKDEIPDPHNLRIQQWLNDELKTDSNSSNAVTKFPEFISYLSSFLTLEPGDLILAGSPRPIQPGLPTFLSAGDNVRIEIEGLGVQENPVIAE